MMKKMMTILLSVMCLLGMTGCAEEAEETGKKTYKVGICNYVDDASLNQIVASIESELKAAGEENDVVFDIAYDNCNADANVMAQIIADFIADDVDLMVGVATPVAMAMQAATEENQIPVVFAAVSDPVSCGVVETLDHPGANITGTSDYLDTNAIMDLIFAADPDIQFVGLLYDQGQDSSTTAITEARAYLEEKNVAYKEYTGTNTSEIQMAVSSIIADQPTAVFTPSDNTVMAAELSIYEDLADAGIKHYAGADSFALNGAFAGYGVDYANLGKVTGDMVVDLLVHEKDPADYPVQTFDNGMATINTDICDTLGLSFDDISALFTPYCTSVKAIETGESFD